MLAKTSDNRDIYYELTGNPGAAETIVFLNGLTQSTASWGLMIPYFSLHYRILLLDLVFQGRSDKSGEWRDFDTHAGDVRRVLDQEKISSVMLAGLSYGSLVAQHFAVLYPAYVNKLVLLSTFAHKTPYYDAVELGWWRALETGGYNLMLDIMLPTVLSEHYFSNPLIPIAAMKEARKEMHQHPDAIFSLMRATKQRKDYREDLRKIVTPTLIIQGEKDLLLPVHLAREVQKNIKGSRLLVISNAGHTLNLEHVPEVCAAIIDFLKQVE